MVIRRAALTRFYLLRLRGGREQGSQYSVLPYHNAQKRIKTKVTKVLYDW